MHQNLSPGRSETIPFWTRAGLFWSPWLPPAELQSVIWDSQVWFHKQHEGKTTYKGKQYTIYKNIQSTPRSLFWFTILHATFVSLRKYNRLQTYILDVNLWRHPPNKLFFSNYKKYLEFSLKSTAISGSLSIDMNWHLTFSFLFSVYSWRQESI